MHAFMNGNVPAINIFDIYKIGMEYLWPLENLKRKADSYHEKIFGKDSSSAVEEKSFTKGEGQIHLLIFHPNVVLK